MIRTLFLILCLSLPALSLAQPQFPVLTGRVVDNANILSASVRTELTQQLAQHEQETSNQVVVVTLQELGGYDISDYGYQLGRYWKIGQAEKDNGALLIVAMQERKVRIEVGYGLEGALTDALSSQIIRNEITPLFKQGQFEQGVSVGVQSILQAIQGEYTPSTSDQHGGGSGFDKVLPFVMFGAVGGQMLLAPLLGRGRKKKRDVQSRMLAAGGAGTVTGVVSGIVLASLQLGLIAGVGALVLSFLFFGNGGGGGRGRGGGYRGGGWGGSSGGGGFGGGGGGFGGGGASGGW